MKFEAPKFNQEKKETSTERFNTTFKKIESRNEADELRLNSFENFPKDTKEALSYVGKIFKDANATYPWAIHGSCALVLEAETAKQPVDIDLAFGRPDFEKVFDEFKKLEQKGLVRKLESEEMKDLKNKSNGCIKIFAEIKTSENPEVWIEVEAFSQNIDPKNPKNGITNPGLEKTGINVYEKNGIEINFSDREEIYKFYLQVAYIELQKYQIDDRSMKGIKNKFPQRLQNLISVILREKFEKQLKSGEASKDQKPNIENISDEDINKLIEEFLEYNKDNQALKLSDTGHSKIDPAKVIKTMFNDFRTERFDGINEQNKGFVKNEIENNSSQGRETIVDNLTQKQLKDMEGITQKYNKLNNLNKVCEETKTCNKETIEDILNTSERFLNELSKIKIEYEKYLNMINYDDNRDFIPYVSIKAMLEEFVIPTTELAIVVQSKVLAGVYV